MSAFRPVPSASPPGADLSGDASVRLLLTQSGHSQVSSHLSSRKQHLIYPDGSAKKYCSASIMLGKTAEVTHEVEIVAVAYRGLARRLLRLAPFTRVPAAGPRLLAVNVVFRVGRGGAVLGRGQAGDVLEHPVERSQAGRVGPVLGSPD